MSNEHETSHETSKEKEQIESRRNFLRKSAFAIYTTPLITSMLVEKANAAKSWNSGKGEITGTATPKPPDGGTVGPDPGRGVDNRPTP